VQELATLVVVVIAMMVVTALVARPLGQWLRRIETLLLNGAIAVIFFVMLSVSAEVVMRYAFNSPIPGHLEGSELLMPVIVFLAISYTQATHGHVGMDLALDALAPARRRYAEMATLLITIFICAILAYFSFKNAYQLWVYDDVTMTPPYFRTWPAASAIPLGYGMISIRLFLQMLHLYDAERFPANEPKAVGFHATE
jgi:TRAP-type C4-dicarboxylate transport system permease small subunit